MSARSVKGFHVLGVMRRNRLVDAEHRVHVAIGEAYDAGAKQAARDFIRLLDEAERTGQTKAVIEVIRKAAGL